eukprot:7258384-Pyramimonas_sp.AAC.1
MGQWDGAWGGNVRRNQSPLLPPSPLPDLGKPKGTHTATPLTSPGVSSNQDFEANPAVPARACQEAPKGETQAKVAIWVPVPSSKITPNPKLSSFQ